MVQRYVRVKNREGKIYYGLLQLSLNVQALDAPPWLHGQPTEVYFEPDDYQLLAPCSPSKIVAVGKNYADHAAEMGTDVPKEPLIFLKPATSVIAADGEIIYPPQSQQVDYEGELALVIGDRVTCCTPAEAHGRIWGYTIANDVTARDLQRHDGQWTRAKGFDSFCPLGPWIVRELNPGARLQTFLLHQSSYDFVAGGCGVDRNTHGSRCDEFRRSHSRGNRGNWSFGKYCGFSLGYLL
jgi:2-keto-4-pentenoate hydratase/2-oxohepta-3-ene-1,7-dioic acid hydratase in catechol pathway